MPHLRQCSFSDCGETESNLRTFLVCKKCKDLKMPRGQGNHYCSYQCHVSQELLLWFKVFYKLIRIKLFLPAQGGSIRSIFVITLSIKVNTGQG